MLRIAHLVDDTNPGGVTRYLDFLARDPGMAALARHEIVEVPRTRAASARVQADVIVSHLTGTILDTGQLSPFTESASSPAFAPQSQAI